MNSDQKKYLKIGLGVTALAGLYFGKRYVNGGVCKLNADLKGQVVVVTGANTGIGKETALLLAKQGATVVVACRDQNKGAEAVAEITKATGSTEIHLFELDLSQFASVEKFATDFKAKFSKLNILIHNAGVWQINPTESKDGFDEIFQVNYLSPIYLTSLLQDVLIAAKPSRVVWVSSALHKWIKSLRKDDIQSLKTYQGMEGAYSHSKLLANLAVLTMNKKLESQGVKVVSLHPGVVRTELGRHRTKGFGATVKQILIWPIWTFLTKDVTAGSQTSVHCALLPHDSLQGGEYYADCELSPPNHIVRNDSDREEMWAATVKLLERKGKSLTFA
jgi:retinol dehydrogenase-12